MPKSIPQRMCTGCRERKNKTDLVRVVRSPEGDISLDLTGRKNGRGAYICRDVQCLEKARRQRSLERALEQSISDEVYEQLLADIKGEDDDE